MELPTTVEEMMEFLKSAPPETVTKLQELAKGDPDVRVRQVAAHQLARLIDDGE